MRRDILYLHSPRSDRLTCGDVTRIVLVQVRSAFRLDVLGLPISTRFALSSFQARLQVLGPLHLTIER